MTQISYAVLIVLGLVFTAYFGVAAWRLSSDDHAEITGTIMPGHKWVFDATVEHNRPW
jgi:hypothetical protein